MVPGTILIFDPEKGARHLLLMVPGTFLSWFSLNWRTSARALRTLAFERLRFKEAWGMLKMIG
jgi:hypothetical protein